MTGNDILGIIDLLNLEPHNIKFWTVKPDLIDITFKELSNMITIIGPRRRNKLLIAESIDNVKGIFIINDVECPKIDHCNPLNIKIPLGEENVYEEFRINLISDLIKNFSSITDQIKIVKIEYGGIARWIFSPACEYVSKEHLQNSDGIVKYFHIKHNIYIRTMIDYDYQILFEYHKKAFSYIKIIYYFIIINHFDLCNDITNKIKKEILSF